MFLKNNRSTFYGAKWAMIRLLFSLILMEQENYMYNLGP
jgi:hypothetical protein